MKDPCIGLRHSVLGGEDQDCERSSGAGVNQLGVLLPALAIRDDARRLTREMLQRLRGIGKEPA
jgi:hypothetical protein